jgi:hypothetical protein
MSDATDTGRREARLDELREEARRVAPAGGTVDGAGVRAAGGPVPARATGDPRPGYRGMPVVKPPVWTWEVPVYFFVGGGAGMATVLALAALLVPTMGGGPELVRAAYVVAGMGMVLSPILLIADLGRSSRFLYMLRVFKWRSPMSMGVWILMAWSAFTAPAMLLAWLAPGFVEAGPGRALLLAAAVPAALFGALLATYTGVLVGATVIPAWRAHHRTLPFHFGIAGLGSAVAVLELVGFRLPPLHVLGLGAAALETLFGLLVEVQRHGAADRALRLGWPAVLLRGSGLLAGPVSLGLRLLGLVPAAAAAFLLGALLSRFGWVSAGKASGADPEAALARVS